MECQCAAAAAAWGFDQSMSISRWTLNEGCWLNPNMIIFVGGLSACSLCNFPWLTSIPRFVGQVALKISSIPLFFWVEITWTPELLLGQHVFLGGPTGPTGPTPTPISVIPRPRWGLTAKELLVYFDDDGNGALSADELGTVRSGEVMGLFWWRLMGLDWEILWDPQVISRDSNGILRWF